MTRDELYSLIESHVGITDEWGGAKLSNWEWGYNVVLYGVDDLIDALVLEFGIELDG